MLELTFSFFKLIFFILNLGVLESGDEFHSSNDVYEAIGEVLHDVASDRDEDSIR